MKCYTVSKMGSTTTVNVFRNKKERDDWLDSANGWGAKKASCFNIVILLLRSIIYVFIVLLWDIFALVMLLFGCMLNCLKGCFSINIHSNNNFKA